jgi:hypothetical protein
MYTQDYSIQLSPQIYQIQISRGCTRPKLVEQAVPTYNSLRNDLLKHDIEQSYEKTGESWK